MSLRCSLGIHNWWYCKNARNEKERHCYRCEKEQEWAQDVDGCYWCDK